MTQILRVASLSLPSGWRNEVFRGLTKCQAVPSEGSAVLCTTGEYASVTSVISEINVHPWGDKGIRDEREQCHQCHPLTLIIHRDASKLSNNSINPALQAFSPSHLGNSSKLDCSRFVVNCK